MLDFTRRNLGIAAGMATAVVLTAGALISMSADASPSVALGDAAPTFTATTSTGEMLSSADLAGQTVVLEWTNHGCPFVQKHYAEPARNMQTLQANAARDNVVWLQVISSASGKQGHVDGAGATAQNLSRGATPAYTILDPSGDIGRSFGAKTTPHMFVVSAEQDIVYSGAIDSVRSADADDISGATNYIADALEAIQAGEAVEVASTPPYGCSVKY